MRSVLRMTLPPLAAAWLASTAATAAGAPPRAAKLPSSSAPQLIQALASADVEARVRAATALGDLETPAVEALPALTRALEDPSARVRRVAALALGKIVPTTPDVVAALVKALGDPDPNVPDNAAWALRTLGRPAVPGLLRGLAAGDVRIRRAAAQVLATGLALRRSDFATHDATVALTAALRDPDAEVRAEATRALGEVGAGARAALPALRQLAREDPVEEVRRLADRAVSRIQKR